MTSVSLIGMIIYPGSNCDRDCEKALWELFQIKVVKIWHKEKNLPKLRGIILPGGFSYGDYLRSGALASLSPVMEGIKEHAKNGGAILGICNGFQVLTESHLLPGTLLRNESHKFICKELSLSPQKNSTVWNDTVGEDKLRIPIAHKEGRYYIKEDGLSELEKNEQILLRYEGENPNGSTSDIAGVSSKDGKIMGMMPHPERAALAGRHQSQDGKKVLESFLAQSL